MGLVNQLQEAAEWDDVLTVLRKAKRVSVKLGRRDICQWLEHEQNGYPDGDAVPEYRRIPVTFCYRTNGYVPAGYGQLMNGIVPLLGIAEGCSTLICQPISTVMDWVESMKSGNGIYEALSTEESETLRGALKCNMPELLHHVTFMAQLDSSQLRVIPEHIKNRALDWACDLEAAGVTGKGQSFSENEKRAAQTVIFNITNSSIDQLNNSGSNIKKGT